MACFLFSGSIFLIAFVACNAQTLRHDDSRKKAFHVEEPTALVDHVNMSTAFVSVPRAANFIFQNNTLLIVVGGVNGTHAVADVIRTTSNSTHYNSEISSSPFGPLFDFGSTVVNDSTLYVAGGRSENFPDRNAPTSKFWAYDVATNKWSLLAPLPHALYANLLVASKNGDVVYSLGGYASQPITTVYVYNVSEGIWSEKDTPLPHRANVECAVAVDTEKGLSIYILSERYLYRSDGGAQSWIQLNSMNVDVVGASCVAIENEAILVVGGLSNYRATDRVEMYNITTGNWSIKAPMTDVRGYLGLVAIPDTTYVLVCGGVEMPPPYDSCEAYDWQKNQWLELKFKLSSPLTQFGMHSVRKAVKVLPFN